MTPEDSRSCLTAAKQALDGNSFDEALPLIMSVLREDVDNPYALHLLGWLYMKIGEAYLPLAYQIYRRAVNLYPKRREMWNNLSRCADELHRYDEALGMSLKSIALDAQYAPGYSNAACSLVNMGRYAEALKYAEAGLELAPADRNCLTNKGFALLGLQRWGEAWAFYEHTLGHRYRLEWVYGTEPRWDGTKGKRVIVYGEQGIGDELMYAQCVPDAVTDCAHVIVDCDHRLEGLFRRSFPAAEVHGTRRRNDVEWLEGKQYDARCAMGSLASFYRRSDEAFPRKPYLVADFERRLMWRALFDTYEKPVIGIAWTGGRDVTGGKFRTLQLTDFLPLMRDLDATWVSLEYKDRSEEIAQFKKTHGIEVRSFPWINRTDDYDDTAALIAECDMVFGIHTTSLHCAGALGKKVVCLTPAMPQWRYAGEDFPWYADFTLHKQRKNESWLNTVSKVDRAHFGSISRGARKAA